MVNHKIKVVVTAEGIGYDTMITKIFPIFLFMLCPCFLHHNFCSTSHQNVESIHTAWIWDGFVTCFNQYNVVELIRVSVLSPGFKSHCVIPLSLQPCCRHVNESWLASRRMRPTEGKSRCSSWGHPIPVLASRTPAMWESLIKMIRAAYLTYWSSEDWREEPR